MCPHPGLTPAGTPDATPTTDSPRPCHHSDVDGFNRKAAHAQMRREIRNVPRHDVPCELQPQMTVAVPSTSQTVTHASPPLPTPTAPVSWPTERLRHDRRWYPGTQGQASRRLPARPRRVPDHSNWVR